MPAITSGIQAANVSKYVQCLEHSRRLKQKAQETVPGVLLSTALPFLHPHPPYQLRMRTARLSRSAYGSFGNLTGMTMDFHSLDGLAAVPCGSRTL